MGSSRGPRGNVMEAQRILILAPHPDDEIVACGIMAARAKAAGATVFGLFLTTGVPPHEAMWPWRRHTWAAHVQRRRDEAIAAGVLSGIEPVGFLETPSRHLRHHLDQTRTAIEQAIVAMRAEALWGPAFEGAHQDHDAANALAASFARRLPVYEFAAYNFAGGAVRSNTFPAPSADDAVVELTAAEAGRKREMLAVYRSERGNLRHIRVAQESWRPLPVHDYGAPPHPGKLFRERFHWVPFSHPRVDFDPSAEVYEHLARWRAAEQSRPVTADPVHARPIILTDYP